MNRINRLSAILTLLQSSSSVKLQQLMDRFQIGKRTVYRDIKTLEETGIPIAGDSRNGYSLVDGFKLPPLMFSEKEAFAFLAAEKLVERFSDLGLQEGYHSGVDKIKAVMKLAEKESTTFMSNQIGVLDFHGPLAPPTFSYLYELMTCIMKHQQAELNYFSANEVLSQRTIEPIGIFFSMANWYCIAFCHDKEDYRTFKLNRIQKLTPNGVPFNKKHPSLESLLKTMVEQPDLQKVIIEVEHKKLPLLDESKYYQGLIAEIEKGNTLELHFMVFSLERFARWYLSYIDIAHIILPQNLRTTIDNILNNKK